MNRRSSAGGVWLWMSVLLVCLSLAHVTGCGGRGAMNLVDATGRTDPIEGLTPDPAWTSSRHEPYDWIDRTRLVAHGLGAIEGKRITNSLEAFQTNYARGYRVFEVDLVPSADGVLVARHDWLAYMYDFLGQRVDNPYKVLTAREFQRLPIHGRFTPLTVDDVVALMKAYPDAYVMTDTKSDDVAAFRAAMDDLDRALGSAGILKERIIIQIYDEPMLSVAREHGYRNVLYTLYQLRGSKDRALDFARDNGIRIVGVPEAMWTRSFAGKARKRGVDLGVYTVNDPSRAEELWASGVRLLWSDRLSPTGARP